MMRSRSFKIVVAVTGRFILRRTVAFAFGCLLVFSSANAQSISHPEKIRSVTEVVIETKGTKESEVKKSFQQFDMKGNVTENIEYEDDGKVKNHSTYEYNDLNQKVKETEFLPDGKVESVAVYTYDQYGNRATKTMMDKDGEVKSKKVFRYEYR
jgi:S-adenosylmethionine hydrolase